MAHTITVTDSVPNAVPRTYTAPTLPGLICQVLMSEFDIAPVDMDLAPDEFPSEILNCWRNPTLGNLECALSPLATCTLE